MLERSPPWLLVIAAAVSVQAGAVIAFNLFDEVGPRGAVLLRLGFAALLLLPFSRGALRASRGRPVGWVLLFGLVLAAMNSLFYQALARVPLGVAVTVEFVGPLVLAVALSRRLLDLVWVALAAAGVLLLGAPASDVDRAGIAFALGAGACWALYVVVGKRVSATWPLRSGLTASIVVAAVVLLPIGLASSGEQLADAGVLARGLAVAVLSSVIPYGLELAALRRLSASTFSILLSLGPAIAALVGAVVLHQTPEPLEAVAIACVVAASIGSSRAARQALPPPD